MEYLLQIITDEPMIEDNTMPVPVTADSCSYGTEPIHNDGLPVETPIKNVKPSLKRARPTWNLDETEEAEDERCYLNNQNEQNLLVLKIMKLNQEERRTAVGKHVLNPYYKLDLNERPEDTYLRIARVKMERVRLRRLHYALKGVVKRLPL